VRHLTSEVRQQELDWRRSQVLQYSSQGYSIREIAQKLQIDKSSVNRDIQFLKQQAQNNLQHHIHEVIPMELERCMVGMKGNLKHVLEIAERAADPKTKLQARAIANDCYKYIMDLATNGAIITDAIKYVNQKQEQIDTLHKLDERIEAAEEETTQTVSFK
jgi:DNA-binding transcriptional regulator LsrR (DeoR family)